MKIAVSSPLLETTINGASHVLVNISGSVSLAEANEAVEYIREMADPEANIIFGTAYHETAEDTVTVTVIATGVKAAGEKPAKKADKPKERKEATENRSLMDMIGATQKKAEPEPEKEEEVSVPSFINYTDRTKRSNDELSIKIPDFLKKTGR